MAFGNCLFRYTALTFPVNILDDKLEQTTHKNPGIGILSNYHIQWLNDINVTLNTYCNQDTNDSTTAACPPLLLL